MLGQILQSNLRCMKVKKSCKKRARYGATCVTTLNLPSGINGTGRIAIADSWFGSVKTVIALEKSDLLGGFP